MGDGKGGCYGNGFRWFSICSAIDRNSALDYLWASDRLKIQRFTISDISTGQI